MDAALLVEQILALQNRLQALEDHEAIRQLIASYGPAVDSNRLQDAAALWAEGGEYAVAGFGAHTGRAALVDLLAAPHIQLCGQQAVAVNYSVVLRHQGEAYVPERVAANRWELEKTAGQWQVRRRSNALLDGSPAAHDLLDLGAGI